MIPETISRALRAVRRRHAIVRRGDFAVSVCGWTLFVTGIFVALARLGWGAPSPWLHGAVACLTASVAWICLRPRDLDDLAAARLIDDRLQLQDRLATAVERFSDKTHSPLVHWLLRDAERRAEGVDPKKVVPIPPRLAQKSAACALALVVYVAALAVPMPQGAFAPFGISHSSMTAEGASEAALLHLAEVLRQEAERIGSPPMRRLVEDLQRLQAGLRDRSLPTDEAQALLRVFERRVETAREIAAHDGLDPMSRDDLRASAEPFPRLAPSGDEMAAPNAMEDRSEPSLGSMDGSSAVQGGQQSEVPADDTIASAGAPGDEDANGDSSAATADSSDAGEGTSVDGVPTAAAADQADDAQRESGDSMSTAGAGHAPGGNADDAQFQRIDREDAPALRLQGEALSGPSRLGQIQGSHFQEYGETQIGGASSDESASATWAPPLPEEGIPLDYREAVRLYFSALEPE